VRRVVKSASRKGGPSMHTKEFRKDKKGMTGDAPFSRNSSNCAASSLRNSDSGALCFSNARM
jgi:hypothetical protein